VALEIDLTPGIEIVPVLRHTIDVNQDGDISDNEARVYASNVVGDMDVRHDDVGQRVLLEGYRFPSASDLDEGTGTIRITANVAVRSRGAHHLSFRNRHRPDDSVYLVNIVMNSPHDVAVTDQRRDPLQRGIEIDFSAGPLSGNPFVLLLTLLALTAAALAARIRSRTTFGHVGKKSQPDDQHRPTAATR
jgi:hypothetical protein